MCEDCNWRDKVVELEELLDEERYEWAFDTLEGIKDWAELHQHITERQLEAVENITRQRSE
jgi:hypothetical protein